MLYLYSLPRSLERHKGLNIAAQVAYQDHVLDIPPEAVDKPFIEKAGQLITCLASETSAPRVPSPSECRWCEIADCPVRAEEGSAEEGLTEDF